MEDIPTAVWDMDHSSTSRMVAQEFDNSDRFVLTQDVNSEQEMKKLIDTGQVQMAVCIPPDFGKDIGAGNNSTVLLLVDGSNVIIGNNAYAQAATILQSLSAGIQMKILQGKGMQEVTAEAVALPFQFTDRILYDPRLTYMNYLILAFIVIFLQQVTLSGVGVSVLKYGLSEEFSEQGIFTHCRNILIRIISCGTYGIGSTFVSLWIAQRFFRVQFLGSLWTVLPFCILFVAAISCPAILLAGLVKDRVKFIQVAFMFSLPSFATSGYLWTADQLPHAMVAGVKLLWPLSYIHRAFAEILIKGMNIEVVQGNLIQLGVYILVWMPIVLLIYYKRMKSTV